MKHTKLFEQFLNEAKFSAGGFTCTIIGGQDTKGSYLSFIPDSKTLDNYTTEEAVRWIDQVFNNMEFFRDCMEFEPKHNAAGYVFRIDASDLADSLVKEFKA